MFGREITHTRGAWLAHLAVDRQLVDLPHAVVEVAHLAADADAAVVSQVDKVGASKNLKKSMMFEVTGGRSIPNLSQAHRTPCRNHTGQKRGRLGGLYSE